MVQMLLVQGDREFSLQVHAASGNPVGYG